MSIKKEVFLICGVSGSGKSWVCRQLSNKFNYIPHDEHFNDDLAKVLSEKDNGKPFITECPFGERVLKSQLEWAGFKVRPYFVYEKPFTVYKRFIEREGKEPSKAVMTRAATIKKRIDEWKAPHGSSEELLKMLKETK